MNLPDIWSTIQVDHTQVRCINCGQAAMAVKGVCKTCQTMKEGAVLAVCRGILLTTAPDLKDLKKETKKSDDEPANLREVALAHVLNEFPFELATRTRKFRKSCESDGVWFAHINAYNMICSLRPKETPAKNLIRDPLYKMLRDEFYVMMLGGPQSLNKDKRETIESTYRNAHAPLDGYRIIKQMVLELEKENKLQIARQKGKCPKCGQEISEGQPCPQCSKEEDIERRLSISAAMGSKSSSAAPAPLVQPQHGGMHSKE